MVREVRSRVGDPMIGEIIVISLPFLLLLTSRVRKINTKILTQQ